MAVDHVTFPKRGGKKPRSKCCVTDTRSRYFHKESKITTTPLDYITVKVRLLTSLQRKKAIHFIFTAVFFYKACGVMITFKNNRHFSSSSCSLLSLMFFMDVGSLFVAGPRDDVEPGTAFAMELVRSLTTRQPVI